MSSGELNTGYSCVTQSLATLTNNTECATDNILCSSDLGLSDLLPPELLEIYPIRSQLSVQGKLNTEFINNKRSNEGEEIIICRLLSHQNHCIIHEPNLSFLWDSTSDTDGNEGNTSSVSYVNSNDTTSNKGSNNVSFPLLKTVDNLTECCYSSPRLTSLYASVLYPFALNIAMGPMLDYCQGPLGVILCVSRRQCNEVCEILSPVADALQLVVHNVFVGVPLMPESRRADIVISTPLRLCGMLPTNSPEDKEIGKEGDCRSSRNFSASSVFNFRGDPLSVAQKDLHFRRRDIASSNMASCFYYTFAHVSQLMSFISPEEVLLPFLRVTPSEPQSTSSHSSFLSCLKRILIKGSVGNLSLTKHDSQTESVSVLYPCLPDACRIIFIFDGSTVDLCSGNDESMKTELPSVRSLSANLLMDRFNGDAVVDWLSRPLMCLKTSLSFDSEVPSPTKGYIHLRNAATTSIVQTSQSSPDEWLLLLQREVQEDAEEAIAVWINKRGKSIVRPYTIECRCQFRGCTIDVNIYLVKPVMVECEQQTKEGEFSTAQRVEDESKDICVFDRELLLVLASNFNAVVMRGSHCVAQPVIIPPSDKQLNGLEEKHLYTRSVDTTMLLVPSLVTEGGILSSMRHFPPYWSSTNIVKSEMYGSSTFICIRNLSPDVIFTVPSGTRSDSEDEEEKDGVQRRKCGSSMIYAKMLSDHMELLTSFSKFFLKHEKSLNLPCSSGNDSQTQKVTQRTERHGSVSSLKLTRSNVCDDQGERTQVLADTPSLLQELLELVHLSSTDIYSFACGFVPIVKDQDEHSVRTLPIQQTVMAFSLRCYIETPSWSSAIEAILALDGKPLPPDLAVLWDIDAVQIEDPNGRFPVNACDTGNSARTNWEDDRAATRTLRVETCISCPNSVLSLRNQTINQVSNKSSVKEVTVPAVLALTF